MSNAWETLEGRREWSPNCRGDTMKRKNLTSYECANRISSVWMILSLDFRKLSDIARGRPSAWSLGFCPVAKVFFKIVCANIDGDGDGCKCTCSRHYSFVASILVHALFQEKSTRTKYSVTVVWERTIVKQVWGSGIELHSCHEIGIPWPSHLVTLQSSIKTPESF